MSEAALSQALRQHGLTEPLCELAPGIWGLRVEGDAAVSVWQTLRTIVDVTHHWPVMIDSDRSLDRRADSLSFAEIRDCLETAETEYREIIQWKGKPPPPRPDVGAVLAPLVGRPGLALAELVQALARAPTVAAAEEREAPPSVLANAPDDPPRVLQIPNEPGLVVALVPTELSWQVPAYVPISWEYVDRSSAVCHLRRLDDLFGAELVGMTSSFLELRISRPPADERSARIMSGLLLGPDEGDQVERLIRARWVSLWWD